MKQWNANQERERQKKNEIANITKEFKAGLNPRRSNSTTQRDIEKAQLANKISEQMTKAKGAVQHWRGQKPEEKMQTKWGNAVAQLSPEHRSVMARLEVDLGEDANEFGQDYMKWRRAGQDPNDELYIKWGQQFDLFTDPSDKY
jgi:hypothetical protein